MNDEIQEILYEINHIKGEIKTLFLKKEEVLSLCCMKKYKGFYGEAEILFDHMIAMNEICLKTLRGKLCELRNE